MKQQFEQQQGLECIHSGGVVHCDIKPENIFVGEDGLARIGDFDVSKDMEQRKQQTLQAGKTTLIGELQGKTYTI